MASASYGGIDIFGPLVSIDHDPQASAAQVSAFFGVSGTLQQFGGTRGRTFMVRGVVLADNPAGLRAWESQLQGYADGVARDLVDPYGYTWPNVVFRGEAKLIGPIGWTEAGCCREYRAVFYGLS